MERPRYTTKKKICIEKSIKTIFNKIEEYPQLKTSANLMALVEEYKDIEIRIVAARKFYNSNIRAYNQKIDSFPSNIIAKITSFKKHDFFNNYE